MNIIKLKGKENLKKMKKSFPRKPAFLFSSKQKKKYKNIKKPDRKIF